MKAISEIGMKSSVIWAFVCALIVSICLMVSLIQPQQAYAETKKVSGTLKMYNRLVQTSIRTPNPANKTWVNVDQSIFSSDNKDWNNAYFFYVTYTEISEEYDSKGYGTITHSNGDQIFIEIVSKLTSKGGLVGDTTGVRKGKILGGTGKFEGIKGNFLSKFKQTMMEGRTAEWEVEYKVK